MVKTVFGCEDRDDPAEDMYPEDYNSDLYPVSAMSRSHTLAANFVRFIIVSPLVTSASVTLGNGSKYIYFFITIKIICIDIYSKKRNMIFLIMLVFVFYCHLSSVQNANMNNFMKITLVAGLHFGKFYFWS